MMNSLSRIFLLLSLTDHALGSLFCPKSTVPSSGILKGVGVYKNNDIYRISMDPLLSNNFSALLTSGKARLVTSDSPQCPLANCMFELATNQRNTDTNILHQNNFLNGIAPFGYTKLAVTTPMFCVTIVGDCGADAPIYRYTKPIGMTGNNLYAYSFDSSVEYAGYTREALPICYGWTTSTSYSNCGDGMALSRMAPLTSYVNGFTGAYRDHFATTMTTAAQNGSTLSGYSVAQSLGWVANQPSSPADPLSCNCLVKLTQMFDNQPGIGGSNSAPGLFGRFDHKLVIANTWTNGIGQQYAPTGEVIYCVFEKGTCGATVALNEWYNIFEIDTIYTVDGDPQPQSTQSDGTLCYIWPLNYTLPQICQQAPTVQNGLVTYAQAGQTTSFLQGTVATLTCLSGYAISGNSTMTCAPGAVWNPTGFGSCNEVCPPFPIDPNGAIVYTQNNLPQTTLFVGTTATLTCYDTVNFQVRGSNTASCQAGKTWNPANIGVCSRSCQAVNIANAAPTYKLADNNTPANAPYYEGYIVTLVCNTGTTLVGNGQATCISSVFTPPLGSCASTNG